MSRVLIVCTVIGPVDSSAGALKGTLIRGLTEMKNRFANQTQLANLIEAYIAVQFNSILSNARAGTSNNYTAKWTGPAPSYFQAAGNVAALDVFNSMFSFVPPVEPVTTYVTLAQKEHRNQVLNMTSTAHPRTLRLPLLQLRQTVRLRTLVLLSVA